MVNNMSRPRTQSNAVCPNPGDFLLFSEADKHLKLSCLVTIQSLLYNK